MDGFVSLDTLRMADTGERVVITRVRTVRMAWTYDDDGKLQCVSREVEDSDDPDAETVIVNEYVG